MQVLKFTLLMMLITMSGLLYGSEISELESLRTPYPLYEISDIFGVAKLIQSVLKNSEQLKNLLKDPMDVFRATVLVGGIAAMIKLSMFAVQGFTARIPGVSLTIYRRIASWCMRVLNLPEGFDVEQLLLCEQMFEQIMVVWCEREARISGEHLKGADAHWDYHCRFVQDVLYYLISFFESHQKYYRAIQLKRVGKVVVTHIGDDKIDYVCFLVQSCISSMKHLVSVCEQAKVFAEFDVEHVKKIARSTVVLLRKLSGIVAGEHVQPYQAEYNFTGQALMPALGFFDV
jgi:hypothetical protein